MRRGAAGASGVGVLATGWKPLSHLRIPANHSAVEAEALTAADA